MVGTFTMFEVPTGDADRGLGVGKVWYKLPIWVQKSFGPWTTYGGVGETSRPALPGYRNFTYGGWLVQRDIGKKLTLGTEVFAHGGEGIATAADAGRHFGGCRRLLQVPRSRISTPLLLRPQHCRPGRKLCLSRPVLDVGQQVGGRRFRCRQADQPASVLLRARAVVAARFTRGFKMQTLTTLTPE